MIKAMDAITTLYCKEFELNLNDGTRYRVTCTSEELDKLCDLIGEDKILEVEEYDDA